MARPREGYSHLFADIPTVIFDRIYEEARAERTSAARLLTRLLARHYGIKESDLPPPLKAGPKPGGKRKRPAQ